MNFSISSNETPPRSSKSLGRVPQQKVTSIKEQAILKEGLLCLHKRLVQDADGPIEEVRGPDRPPSFHRSTSSMQASSLLGRLLAGAVELKVCAKGDVCAAQPDLKNLSVQQLLKLRVDTLDFDTESHSFTAHRNFINTVELHLFEKLARLFLQSPVDEVIRSSSWHAFGVQVTLVIGVTEELQRRRLRSQKSLDAEVPPLYPVWVFRLEEQDWPGCKLAMLNVDELWTNLIYEDQDQLTSVLAPEDHVTLIRDRSAGPHRNRMLDLDILPMPANLDDLLEELAMSKSKLLERQMTQELNAVLASRLLKSRPPDDAPVSARQLGGSQRSIDPSDIPTTGTVAERAHAINKKSGSFNLRPHWKTAPTPATKTEENIIIDDRSAPPTASTVAACDYNNAYDGDTYPGDLAQEPLADPLLLSDSLEKPEQEEHTWWIWFGMGCCFVREHAPEHPTIVY